MSKLTENFGEKTVKSADHGVCYQVHDVESLLKHARALEAMLRKLEWSGWDSEYYRKQLCPECGAWSEDPSGHSPDCELAKLLE